MNGFMSSNYESGKKKVQCAFIPYHIYILVL